MIRSASRRAVALIASLGLVASLGLGTAATVAAGTPATISAAGAGFSWGHRDARVCGQPGQSVASCNSVARILQRDGQNFLSKTLAELRDAARAAASVSYTAVGIRTAYGITAQGDPSRVIAIVDAFDDPNAYSNVTTYRNQMNLPAISNCNLSALTGLTSGSSSPCFAKINQSGGTSRPPIPAGRTRSTSTCRQRPPSAPTAAFFLWKPRRTRTPIWQPR